jgi:phytoene dehydrogenase-like protein
VGTGRPSGPGCGRGGAAIGETTDAVVVGAGPNGLTAALALARAGRSVLVLEAADTVGGGVRTRELTEPGFLHDVCSAVYPLAVGSPYLRTLDLGRHGLRYVHPPAPLAHPLDGGTAAMLERSVSATADGLGPAGPAYRRLVEPLVRHADRLFGEILRPPLRPPRHPLVLGRFGVNGVLPATILHRRIPGDPAGGLLAGLAAHSMIPLSQPLTGAVGLMFAVSGHAYGWPIVEGGSQRLADALAAALRDAGGRIETGHRVRRLDDLPRSRTVLFDLAPPHVAAIAGDRLPRWYRSLLRRHRRGPGVFKLDLALSAPLPWTAPECARAATVHLGGTMADVAAAEAAVASGRHPERPFVLLAQPTLFDPSRAPSGKHVVWAYCHVPNGSDADMTTRIEAQIERFAPGARDLIIARSALGPAALEASNPNYLGGDIGGGIADALGMAARPLPRMDPYRTPNPALYLCSASTPPGAGVHGMCGYHAARSALRHALR